MTIDKQNKGEIKRFLFDLQKKSTRKILHKRLTKTLQQQLHKIKEVETETWNQGSTALEEIEKEL